MTRPVLFTGDIFRLQPRGGITRYFAELIPRLTRPTEILAGVHQSQVIQEGRIRASRALYMPTFRLSGRIRAPMNAWIDSGRIRRAKAAILHPTYYRDPAGLSSAPVVLTVYDMAHERFPVLFRQRWWSAKDPARWKGAICARADRIVCISESTRRDLCELLDVPEEKTRVIHLGATDWGSVEARTIPEVTPSFFLWVGERHTYKNFALTFRAWASSPGAWETTLVCAGGPPFTGPERDAFEKAGVSARVMRVTPGDSGLKWAYQQTAGLLYTSLCEGFGLPLLEAMSLGCPAVASHGSSIPEVAGEEAIYVDATSEESIRGGIERCLSEGRSDALAARLRARAAGFSWERCAEAHESLYAELD